MLLLASSRKKNNFNIIIIIIFAVVRLMKSSQYLLMRNEWMKYSAQNKTHIDCIYSSDITVVLLPLRGKY